MKALSHRSAKALIVGLFATILLASCSAKDPALRQQQKALQAQVDSIEAVAAMNALERGVFAVSFDRLNLRHGGSYNVNPTINFVYVSGDKGAVQVASPQAAPGPNGMGGITLSGAVRNYQVSIDRKGNATATYNVSGYGMTASVRLKLAKGSNFATVDVSSNYGSAAMTGYGVLTGVLPNNVLRGYPDN